MQFASAREGERALLRLMKFGALKRKLVGLYPKKYEWELVDH